MLISAHVSVRNLFRIASIPVIAVAALSFLLSRVYRLNEADEEPGKCGHLNSVEAAADHSLSEALAVASNRESPYRTPGTVHERFRRIVFRCFRSKPMKSVDFILQNKSLPREMGTTSLSELKNR
jgi:hypothetical protein